MKTFSGEAVKKTDIDIAKNYLTEEELATLNRMVSAFFDLAELRAMNRQPMYMKDWIQEIDDFSERYGKGVLENAGKVSRNQAVEHASKEYRKYKELNKNRITQVEQDFFNAVKKIDRKK